MTSTWTATPRTESSIRTSTASWKRLRVRVRKRDDYRCQIRGPGCTSEATMVDHIVSVANHGDDSEDNAQSICARCHHSKTGRERQALQPPRATGKRRAPKKRHPADGPEAA